MLIFLNKQRENVENAGRVNKREGFNDETIPGATGGATYLSKSSFTAVARENPAGRASVSISLVVVFDLLK